ncbi:MAG: transporter substrate-binding domain-containing protein [Alphaproteobacteria bacterium]|nr:transporter substrate-binding domain-containing protein [Alphaproteobacteria bacterium]
MKLAQIALVIVLSAATAFTVGKYAAPTVQQTQAKETAFERVMRTGTLRCAYLVMPPQFARDPNTKEMSGLSYDVVMEASKRLKLNVDWVEEVNFMTIVEGYKTGRYDSFCFSGYRWTPWARDMEYTIPLFYSTTDAYVRADDHRFDADLMAINDPSIKVVVSDDGEASTFIRADVFPKSSSYSLPVNVDHSLMLESVATRKADVALFNPLEGMPYLVANPGKLRRVEGHAPIRAYAHTLSFAKGEQNLLSMFNVVLDEMITDGTINKIIDKYETIPNSFIRVKSPVQD